MRNNISLEYAEALFLLSCEENKKEEYLRDLGIVKEALTEEYIMLLRSPEISKEEKLGLIDAAFEGRVLEHIVSFLKLACENGRAELLPMCIENYEKLYNRVNKVIVARVTSAVELTEEEKAKIIAALEKKSGHRVELLCTVDQSVIGGVIISTEDVVIDGSLRRKIHDVKEVIKVEPKT